MKSSNEGASSLVYAALDPILYKVGYFPGFIFTSCCGKKIKQNPYNFCIQEKISYHNNTAL